MDQVEYSKRINPLKRDYIQTLADASETAEAIVESLQKSESSGGSDKIRTMIKEKLLPMQELKMFGVYRDGKFTIPEEQVRALREGRMTDVVELKNLKGKDVQIDSLPARLSIVRGADGNPSLRVDPVYRSPNSHPRLSEEEKKRLIEGEVANVRKDYMARCSR